MCHIYIRKYNDEFLITCNFILLTILFFVFKKQETIAKKEIKLCYLW